MTRPHLALLRVAFLLLMPATALAFETVDALVFPSTGSFPAYPAEPGSEPRSVETWANVGMMYDSNLLRRQSGTEDDTVTRYGLGIRYLGRVIGRQVLRLEGRADYFAYNHFDNLNYLSYGGLGEWRWELGNDLGGTLGYGRDRAMRDLGETQAAVKNLVTLEHAYATAAFRVFEEFRLRGGLDWAHATQSAAAAAEVRTVTSTVGADYVTALGNALGVEYRASNGDAPVPEFVQTAVGILVNNDFKEREAAVVATYIAGTQLRSTARVGHTTRSYTELPNRDFKGTTYRGSVDWLPGNKTRLVFTAYKEPRSIIDVGASHVLTRGVAFGPDWAPTAKLVFSPRLYKERRINQGDPTVALLGGIQRDETLRGIRLGVGWEPARRFHIGFGLDHGERDSNTPGRVYRYNAIMANARLSF
jgi:hypothetical protein